MTNAKMELQNIHKHFPDIHTNFSHILTFAIKNSDNITHNASATKRLLQFLTDEANLFATECINQNADKVFTEKLVELSKQTADLLNETDRHTIHNQLLTLKSWWDQKRTLY